MFGSIALQSMISPETLTPSKEGVFVWATHPP
jgi:hypothetical protein